MPAAQPARQPAPLGPGRGGVEVLPLGDVLWDGSISPRCLRAALVPRKLISLVESVLPSSQPHHLSLAATHGGVSEIWEVYPQIHRCIPGPAATPWAKGELRGPHASLSPLSEGGLRDLLCCLHAQLRSPKQTRQGAGEAPTLLEPCSGFYYLGAAEGSPAMRAS